MRGHHRALVVGRYRGLELAHAPGEHLVVEEMDLVAPDLDQVEVVHYLVGRRDAVHLRAVGARQILEIHRLADDAEEHVASGDRGMVDHDVARRVAPDHRHRLGELHLRNDRIIEA